MKKSPLIPFAILEQSRVILSFVFSSQAGRVRCIVICIYFAPTQMIDGTKKTHSKFANAQRDTTNLAVIASLCHFSLTVSGFGVLRLIQWNPALRTPALYGQFRLSRQKAYIFSLKLTRFIRTPVNPDNGTFLCSESQTLIYCQPRFTDTGYLQSIFIVTIM